MIIPLKIPAISSTQMREVDRLMTGVFQIDLIQMMENAGRHLASLARSEFLANDPRAKTVIVLAGNGGNGGGGLVAARRLHNWGANIQVFLTKEINEYQGVPRHQLAILEYLGITITAPPKSIETLPEADLILDALIGYGLTGNPMGRASDLIRLTNTHSAPVLSLDVPSGIDSTSGKSYEPHVQASATMTLALPKNGLVVDESKDQIGELFLADISVPPELYAHLGLQVGPIFAQDEILKIS